MATKGTIELIPKEIAQAKTRATLLTRIRIISFGIFFISLVALGAIFYYRQTQLSVLEGVETEAFDEEAKIAQYADIEEKTLGLEAKSSAIPQLVSDRNYHSVALAAVEASRPSGIVVAGLVTSSEKTDIDINGSTFSYSQLANFLDNLIDTSKGGVLFSQASLTSVNLDASSGKVNFIIEALIVKNGLKKPLPGGNQ